MKVFNSFARPTAADVILRGETVLIGQVELAHRDLRITAHLGRESIVLSGFNAETGEWKRFGGYWNGRTHRVPLSLAAKLAETIIGLGMHDWLQTTSALVKIDTTARASAQVTVPAMAEGEVTQ